MYISSSNISETNVVVIYLFVSNCADLHVSDVSSIGPSGHGFVPVRVAPCGMAK